MGEQGGKQMKQTLIIALLFVLIFAGIAGMTMYFQWLGRIAERNELPRPVRAYAPMRGHYQLDTACVRIQLEMAESMGIKQGGK